MRGFRAFSLRARFPRLRIHTFKLATSIPTATLNYKMSSLPEKPNPSSTNPTSSPQQKQDPEKEHKHTNNLIHSQSPYLLQHAHNPVDWHQWGEEAFKEAKEKNKPIFLSVG